MQANLQLFQNIAIRENICSSFLLNIKELVGFSKKQEGKEEACSMRPYEFLPSFYRNALIRAIISVNIFSFLEGYACLH